MRHGVMVGFLLQWAVLAACAEDRVLQPQGSVDAGEPIDPGDPDARPATGGVDGGGSASSECDMTGTWIVAQVTTSVALGADQTSVNWFYHSITQQADTFTVNESLNCGFRVTGTTTVTLPDATTLALAENTSSSVGRTGTFTLNGGMCDFSINRAYNIRGADKAQFLANHWTIGDPPKPLGDFPQLPGDAGAGMEDWDSDGMEGITLSTGLGNRYVAQRDWNEHAGTVAPMSTSFGGDGVIVVTWDSQEAVSDQTSVLLRAGSTPQNPGHAYYAKVDGMLTVVPNDKLETCKNVQRLALETWPNP